MLAQQAIVVAPIIKTTTLRVTDKAAGKELTEKKRASDKSATVVKTLIDPTHLKPIVAVQTAFRTYVSNNTVPWMGDTVLLPKDSFQNFAAEVTKYREQLSEEVEKFLQKYTQLVSEARQKLGDLFDASNYPDILDLRFNFDIQVKYGLLPNENQYAQLGLDGETTDYLRAEALQAENDLLHEATENLFKRVAERVNMLRNRLTDENTKRYRESLLEGLRVLVDTMPTLNITGNKQLKEIMDDVQKMISDLTMDQVRESEEVRKDVAGQCDDIMAKMSAMF